MTQLLIDRATLEQLIESLDLSQALLEMRKSNHHASVLAAYKAGRAALANAERVEPDTQRLNWLGQNFYSRENLDFITGRPSKTHTMWVFFAPIKVQGDIRRVLDAAKDEK